MAQVLIPFILFAFAMVGMRRWQWERRMARLEHVVNFRLGGQLSIEADDSDDELALPYFRRVVFPNLRALRGRIARRITPANFHGELEQKLRMAGVNQSAEVFFFTRIATSLAVLLVVGVGVYLFPQVPRLDRLLVPIVLAIVVFLYPSIHLNTKAQERLAEVDHDLPEVFDLLSVSVEAGLAFDGALRKVVASLTGAARDEFARVLADMQLGIPRSEALRALAVRTRSPQLRRFAALVAQSDRTGAGIGPALKIQAHDIKDYRSAKAREKAASIPIKILIPMVLFIFPAMFVIILGPAVVSVLKIYHI